MFERKTMRGGAAPSGETEIRCHSKTIITNTYEMQNSKVPHNSQKQLAHHGNVIAIYLVAKCLQYCYM